MTPEQQSQEVVARVLQTLADHDANVGDTISTAFWLLAKIAEIAPSAVERRWFLQRTHRYLDRLEKDFEH